MSAFPTSLVEHYNGRQSSQYHDPDHTREGEDGTVRLMSRQGTPSTQDIKGGTVDAFVSRTDGVWHPDALEPSMAWYGCGVDAADQGFGSSDTCFNPFAAVDAAELVAAYTEQLTSGSVFQRFMSCTSFSAVAADRGNLAVAHQGGRVTRQT